MLSVPSVLFFFFLGLADQIKWHFNTVAGTLLEMSACQPPPCRPSLSAVDVFISLCVTTHACTVCVNIYTAGFRLQGNSQKRKHLHNYSNSSDFIECFVSSFFCVPFTFIFFQKMRTRERDRKNMGTIIGTAETSVFCLLYFSVCTWKLSLFNL